MWRGGKGTVQTVILAGGQGTRLRPLTDRTPKCLVEVSGQPFLHRQLDLLRANGVRDVVLLVGYLADQVRTSVRDGQDFGLEIRYSSERDPLGTAGAVKHAEPLLETEFVLLYGDSYLAIDYRDFWRRFRAAGLAAMIAVYDNASSGDTGVRANVALGAGGRITAYRKDAGGAALTHVDAGVVALKRAVLDRIASGVSASLEGDLYPALAAQGELAAYPTDRRFYDIGTPERLAVFEQALA